MEISHDRPDVFLAFKSRAAAFEYRTVHGCGGYIFENRDRGECVIFPAGWSPSIIMNHPMGKGNGEFFC